MIAEPEGQVLNHSRVFAERPLEHINAYVPSIGLVSLGFVVQSRGEGEDVGVGQFDAALLDAGTDHGLKLLFLEGAVTCRKICDFGRTVEY